MKPTEILMSEHRIIEKILKIALKEAVSIRASGNVNIEKVEKILDFVRNFADRCHHGKEEKNLFRVLTEKGMSEEFGPIGVMKNEHNVGREFIRNAGDALKLYTSGDTSASTLVSENLEGYADLLFRHIYKEDNILFQMADNMLSEAENDELVAIFEDVEINEMGFGFHEKYHNLAEELAGTELVNG